MTKIEAARQEYTQWCTALKVTDLSVINKIVSNGYAIPLINLCEARQERKYAEVADQLFFNRDNCKLVMMSGPSSSGKTSSSLRIAQQCRVLGIKPIVVELDNYFVDRERTPRDEKGDYDYEALEAMDIELLNENLTDLIAGKEVTLPKFDFKEGKQYRKGGETISLEDGDMLFMEGIHALNPALTPAVDHSKQYNVFIAPLSALPGGTKENSSTLDKRLLRRIVRDNRTRGISPEDNILRWPSVRNGEIKHIYPYACNADIVFNSSTLYDIPLLRYYAEPLLKEIKSDSPAYSVARDLLDFMSQITPLKPEEIAAIPVTSIMREFIGGQKLY